MHLQSGSGSHTWNNGNCCWGEMIAACLALGHLAAAETVQSDPATAAEEAW